jgi:hypothetical protein
MYQRWLYCDEAVRRITTCCIVVCCSAMYGAVAWHGTAGGLGVVRCAVDGAGWARQAFMSASGFNQNIGSWNTASVSIMAGVRALVPSPACGAQPTSLIAVAVPAASEPGAVVGKVWFSF